MALKPSLQLKTTLKLQLTPQLEQSIRLLGLSQLELLAELQPLIEANPLLELEPDDSSELANERLQEARWLLKSLTQRATTLLRVGQAIVTRQQAFFEHGPPAMQPLLLRDIAQDLELHVSTVSRAVRHKYLHCPRGPLPLKHFFSVQLGPAPAQAQSYLRTRQRGPATAVNCGPES